MVITFVGTDKGSNSSKKVVAAIGSMLSLSNNKRVCIIQITNDQTGVDSLFMGKAFKQSELNKLKKRGVNDKGLDALIRKASSMKLDKDHYHTACNAMLVSDNRLDVLAPSEQKSFIDNIYADNNVDTIKRIIEDAGQFYHFVLVLLPKDERVIQSFITTGDVNVCCLRQSEHEEPYVTDKRNIFVTTNFDPESAYDLKRISKEYHNDDPKAKHFAFLYNTQFRDACHELSLLKWMHKNYNVTTSDINYDFISALQNLTDIVSDTEAEEISEPMPKKRQKAPKLEKPKKRKLSDLENPAPEEMEENSEAKVSENTEEN